MIATLAVISLINGARVASRNSSQNILSVTDIRSSVNSPIMRRPFKKIEDVLDELGVPKQLRHGLTAATRKIVDLHRSKDPLQTRKYIVDDVLPLPLASEFLRKHGQMLYDEKGEWTLQNLSEHKDEELREGFAHIIGRQILGREEHGSRGKCAQTRKAEDELGEEEPERSGTSDRGLKRRRRDACRSPLNLHCCAILTSSSID